MNFKELKELIEIVSTTENIEELEVEKAGVRLKVRKAGSSPKPTAGFGSPAAEDAVRVLSQPSAETASAAETSGVFPWFPPWWVRSTGRPTRMQSLL